METCLPCAYFFLALHFPIICLLPMVGCCELERLKHWSIAKNIERDEISPLLAYGWMTRDYLLLLARPINSPSICDETTDTHTNIENSILIKFTYLSLVHSMQHLMWPTLYSLAQHFQIIQFFFEISALDKLFFVDFISTMWFRWKREFYFFRFCDFIFCLFPWHTAKCNVQTHTERERMNVNELRKSFGFSSSFVCILIKSLMQAKFFYTQNTLLQWREWIPPPHLTLTKGCWNITWRIIVCDSNFFPCQILWMSVSENELSLLGDL